MTNPWARPAPTGETVGMETKELHEAQIFGRSDLMLGQVLVGEGVKKVVLPGRRESPPADDQE